MKCVVSGTAQEVEVSSHVVLDSGWDVKSELHEDALDVEFRSSRNSVGFYITEEMIEMLSTLFTEAQEHFHEVEESERRSTMAAT